MWLLDATDKRMTFLQSILVAQASGCLRYFTKPRSFPLQWGSAWSDLLASHSDKAFVAYILEGIQDDFSIGFDYVHHRCRPVKKYMQSATNVPHIVSNSLDTECKLARVVIPDEAAAYTVQISPLGSYQNAECLKLGGSYYISHPP